MWDAATFGTTLPAFKASRDSGSVQTLGAFTFSMGLRHESAGYRLSY
jgi:hypothetical protein